MTVTLDAPSHYLEAQAGDEEWSDNESQARRQRHVLGQVHALYAPLVRQAMSGTESVSFSVSGTPKPAPWVLGGVVDKGDAEELSCLAIHEAVRKTKRTPETVFTLHVWQGRYYIYAV